MDDWMTPNMQRVLFILCAILTYTALSGCAGVASVKNPELTGYVKVSKGSAGGFVAPITGHADYCLVEKHNVQVTAAVEYADGECRVVLQVQ